MSRWDVWLTAGSSVTTLIGGIWVVARWALRRAERMIRPWLALPQEVAELSAWREAHENVHAGGAAAQSVNGSAAAPHA